MSHEIDMSTGQAAFAGITPAWHQLGSIILPTDSIDDIRRKAGLNFNVRSAQSLFRPAEMQGDPAPFMTMVDPESQILYRDDTGAIVGRVSSSYKVHQVSEIIETLRAMYDGHGWKITSMGALFNGARIFGTAQRDEKAMPYGTKEWIENYLGLKGSFDGSTRTIGEQSTVCTVCWNTWQASEEENRRKGKKHAGQSHRSKYNGDKLLADMGLTPDGDDMTQVFQQSIAQASKLAQIGVNPETARAIFDGLLKGEPRRLSDFQQSKDAREVQQDAPPAAVIEELKQPSDFAALLAKPVNLSIGPKEKETSPERIFAAMNERRKEHANTLRILDLFTGSGIGAGMVGRKGTAWGAVNAVTEFVDHHASRTPETRWTNSQYGLGAKLKAAAVTAFLT